jgi:predicted RNA binding protein YcfA (HicA-like mRNA interferase family)
MKRKHPKQRPLPPLTAADIVRMLTADGFQEVTGTKHRAFEHPERGGKVSVSMKWTGLRFGHDAMRGVMAQAGWTREDVRRLYFVGRR